MKIKLLLVSFFFSSILGCVSVNLPTTTVEKAKNVNFKPPATPFKEAKSPSSDQMWISNKTASTISFFTSCSSSEPNLKVIRSTAFTSLESVEITKEETITLNDREALKSTINGKLESVPVTIQFIVFKKNSCSYHLSYVALKENYEKEISNFTTFVNNFRVP